VQRILRRIKDLARQFSGAPMTDVTRSFMRLAQASFEQSVRRVGDADSMDRLSEILERAAREVENVGRKAEDVDRKAEEKAPSGPSGRGAEEEE
jgi:hypothetical protein